MLKGVPNSCYTPDIELTHESDAELEPSTQGYQLAFKKVVLTRFYDFLKIFSPQISDDFLEEEKIVYTFPNVLRIFVNVLKVGRLK